MDSCWLLFSRVAEAIVGVDFNGIRPWMGSGSGSVVKGVDFQCLGPASIVFPSYIDFISSIRFYLIYLPSWLMPSILSLIYYDLSSSLDIFMAEKYVVVHFKRYGKYIWQCVTYLWK